MQRIVIDTNIFVSALLSPKGNSAEIIDKIGNEESYLYYSKEILAEYKEVLSREKFNFDIAKQNKIINRIERFGNLVDPSASNIILSDESDRIFYDTAKEANAILITGNIKHFPKEDFIKTPAEYLEYIKEKGYL